MGEAVKHSLRRRIGIALILLAFVAGCAPQPPRPPGSPFGGRPPTVRGQKPYQIHGVWYYPLPTAEGYVEEGLASWYGSECQGKPTASGEIYDMWIMTAAHKTLPLGTHVKVTHLKTGKSILVRVNDRGPFVSGRIIDLSCKSAQELGSAQTGVVPVKVEAVQVTTGQMVGQNTQWKLEPVPSFRYGQFTIQIGSFREEKNVNRLKTRMSKSYQSIQVVPFAYRGSSFYRVQVGSYRDLVVAKQEQERLRHQGFRDAFVVAVENE